MYIMACLCILKIYQNRHPDISANSHSSYMVMALIIIVAVLGVVCITIEILKVALTCLCNIL